MEEEWVAAVSRLITAETPEDLAKRQAEVQTIERLVKLPYNLIESKEAQSGRQQ